MLWYLAIVAVLNLALGYMLAVYFGVARSFPNKSTASGNSITNTILTAEVEVEIAEDFEQDSSEDQDRPLISEEKAEKEDEEPIEEDASEEQESSAVDVDAAVAEEVSFLQQTVATYHHRLCEASAFLWATEENLEVGPGDLTAILGATTACQKDFEKNTFNLPGIKDNALVKQVVAAREQMQERLSMTLEMTESAFNEENNALEFMRKSVLAGAEAVFELQETLFKVNSVFANQGPWIDQLASETLVDSVSQLVSLAGAAKEYQQLAATCKEGEHLAVAFIDTDACMQHHRNLGPSNCEELLATVGREIQQAISSSSENATIARITGQRFMVLMPNQMQNAATDAIEKARETLATTTFNQEDQETKVTLSCAIAEKQEEETFSSITERLEEALLEAKRYGRNRTFLHEENCPVPVVPPLLEIEPRNVEFGTIQASMA